MNREMRRYPRVSLATPGHVEIPVTSTPETGSVSVPVVFESISCRGASVAVSSKDGARIVPGTRVSALFRADDHEFRLPAQVVWAAGSRAGLVLCVREADESMRAAYAAWIVPLTNREIARARESQSR